MYDEKIRAKEEICRIMRRTYECGLTTSLGGNISMRLGSLMLITPSSLDKASLSVDDIAEVDIESGENLTKSLRLSIESSMHRLIYLKRKSAVAVLHAHPVYSSLFSSSSEEIRTDITAESYYQLGRVKKTPYALMGSLGLAERVSNDALSSSALLMEKHGAITISDKSLLDALERLECLERAARMSLFARFLTLDGLNDEEKKELDKMK